MATAQGQEKEPGFKFPDEINSSATQVLADGDTLEVSVEGDEPAHVEVVDDTPAEDRGRKPLEASVEDPTDEEMAAYSENVQKRMKALTAARHEERRAKEAASRERDELERFARAQAEENKRLKQYVNTGEQAYGKTLTAAAEAKLEAAKRKYKDAHEAYDTDALLAAQQELTEAQWELASAKNFKPTPLQTKEEGVQPEITEQASTRPDDKTVRWQARNQWFGVDEEMTALALAKHKLLIAEGVDPRSDAYFEKLDGRMREKFPEVFGEPHQTRNIPAPRRPASVVASATRSTGTKKIVLTKTAVALAKKMGLTNEQYAQSVAQLEKQNG